MTKKVRLTECPRDAWQGLPFIATEKKVDYAKKLLTVGFDTLDIGSFVSAQKVPQTRDTHELLTNIRSEWEKTNTRLLVIVANKRGAEEARKHSHISYVGFPLSVSETFQKRNTNKNMAQAYDSLQSVRDTLSSSQHVVVYLSMAFGNPYGETYDIDQVLEQLERLQGLDFAQFSLADTTGLAKPKDIDHALSKINQHFTGLELSLHLHSASNEVKEKMAASHQAGCRHFEGALLGEGGCPFAQDDRVGNLPTEQMIRYLSAQGEELKIAEKELKEALSEAKKLFRPVDA